MEKRLSGRKETATSLCVRAAAERKRRMGWPCCCAPRGMPGRKRPGGQRWQRRARRGADAPPRAEKRWTQRERERKPRPVIHRVLSNAFLGSASPAARRRSPQCTYLLSGLRRMSNLAGCCRWPFTPNHLRRQTATIKYCTAPRTLPRTGNFNANWPWQIAFFRPWFAFDLLCALVLNGSSFLLIPPQWWHNWDQEWIVLFPIFFFFIRLKVDSCYLTLSYFTGYTQILNYNGKIILFYHFNSRMHIFVKKCRSYE